MMYKVILILMIFIVSTPVFSSGDHHHDAPAPVTNVTQEYSTSVINRYSADGVAASMAMTGIDFTLNVKKSQYGCSGSWYENRNGKSSEAGACGAAKLMCIGDTCGLGSIKASKENKGGKGFVASFMTTF